MHSGPNQKIPGYLRSFAISALLLLIILLGGCDMGEKPKDISADKFLTQKELQKLQTANKDKDKDNHIFLFGFDLRSSPQEDARQYLPFLAYLERKTGYRFRLRFTPKDGTIVDDLGKGVIHFAAVGAVSYLRAAQQYKVIPLARGINDNGKAEYSSAIIVHQNSAIKSLDDIRGKRMAFGDLTSTQGHLIPRIILSKNNIELRELANIEYTGSHQNCADAVISSRADVCGLQDTMAFTLAKTSPVRILHISDLYPSSGIVANKDVLPEALARIKTALINFQPQGRDAHGLYHWDKTEMPKGFIAASPDDYEPMHQWLHKLKVFHDKNH